MDKLQYDYDSGNRLLAVTDGSSSRKGFSDGNKNGEDYDYDANGNLMVDKNKGITAITYNHLNLPERITIGGLEIKYTYDATGVKLRKEIPNKITDYAGNYINEKKGSEAMTLQFFNTPEGYASYENGKFNYVYNYVDHLGNLRLSYTDGDHNVSIDPASEIIQEKNYYPFGLTHQGYNTGSSAYGNDAAKRYGFGGKELQDENISGNTLDWYDVSARNYDPALGRWMNIDPLAEQMRRHSPYNYAFNNPIFFMDPDGMAPSCNSCPWPNASGKLRSLSNYMGNKINSSLKSLSTKINNIGNSISSALNFEPRGGVVGYADNGFTKHGMVETRRAQSGVDITYADLTGAMVAAEVYGPQLEGKIEEGAQLSSDLISNFLDPNAKQVGDTDTSSLKDVTSDNDTPKERYVITKYMTYPTEARKIHFDTLEGSQDCNTP